MASSHSIQSMIPVNGAWSAEITNKDGTVSVTPIVAWVVLDGGTVADITPVVVGSSVGRLVTLPYAGHGGEIRLLLDGKDPRQVIVEHEGDPSRVNRGGATEEAGYLAAKHGYRLIVLAEDTGRCILAPADTVREFDSGYDAWRYLESEPEPAKESA